MSEGTTKNAYTQVFEQKITQAVKNVYKSIGKEGVSDCSFCTFRGDVPLICACGECWPCWSGRSP